jgi:DMSO/TMAO reductase YedYZ molybdopterin-dependent catalytic subunit
MVTRVFYRWLSKSPGDGGERSPLSRRVLLASAFAGLLEAQKAEVSGFDLSLLDEPLTPAELFFVREHFPAPAASTVGSKLSVGGAVAAPFEISYDDLAERPRKKLPVTLECAENPVGGGLVSHAEWSGVSLASLIEQARAATDARFVRLSGADGFTRTIPLSKAMHPDTLAVNQMNGEKLPANHGFPLRAVIPGWYGMDSVKWLRRIDVLTAPEGGQGYERQVRSLLAGVRTTGPVTAMQVKSVFSRPVDGAILASRRFILRGAAWAGENKIQQVEVSTDGGKKWTVARLDFEALPYAWVYWSYDWKIPSAGPYDLSVRATDERGRKQPLDREPDRADSFEFNVPQTIRITVT